MRSVEVSASTREEAIQMALDKLGADRHEVDVEILDEGSRGLFGIGARPVRLRVTDESARHEPEAQKPPRKRREDSAEERGSEGEGEGEGREQRSRGRRGGRRGRGGNRSENGAREGAAPRGEGDSKPERGERKEGAERGERGERGSRGGRNRRGGRREEAAAETKQDSQAPGNDAREASGAENAEQGEGRSRRRRRRGGATRREGARRAVRSKEGEEKNEPAREESRPQNRGGGESRSRGDQESRPRPERTPRAEREPRPAPQPSEPITEERALEASAFLTEIIEMMGMEATISHDIQEDGGCTLRVSTEDSALLIGRKAQTLLALQYLVNRVIRQHEEENLQLIMVDIEGYIERRREELTELALRMAEEAKEEKRRVRLKPLTPQERRIVHLALQEDEDLRTFSVGDGAMRSVVIAPKDEEAPAGGRRGGRGRGRNRGNGEERPRRVEGRFNDDEGGEAGNAEVAGGNDGGSDETRASGGE